MKRVAVIIFGQPRFFNITWPLIKQEFEFEDVEVDYYIHFWDQVGYTPNSTEVNATDIYSDIDNILSKEFEGHNVQITDYTELDKLCLNLKTFYNNITYNIPVEDYQDGLRYRFGQHLSIKKAYNEIVKHEKEKEFKYDLILKTRSDIIYRFPGCYKTVEEYTRIKKDYYFKAPQENTKWWRDDNQPEATNGYVKCNALRFINFEGKIYNYGGVMEKSIESFHKDKFLEHFDKGVWQDYAERYFTRLAFNDWTLIASREAADIYFGKYFENFYLTVAKDIKQNPTPQRKKCIMSSEHCLQGQFLLNYNILASLPLRDMRRDVRLINKQEIKQDVIPDGKLVCTEGTTTTKYLEYALLKRWSIDKGIGRVKARDMALKHNF